ncbi:Hachiman antiphage defense system protein HamA [Tenacibaculum ovolyticum]|uniref:Hachiman antiphage defense system protein HamA n=1 Tax=Tenacibaculum ovolyticum TaxID=104270 RepID=UPI000A9E48CB|nr:Hachiman antiphage defense system protein HamA [Tenacibaculum ovolyticum]
MIEKELFQIDKNWMEKELLFHLAERFEEKISMRLYTVKPSSTQMDFLSLSSFLTKIIPHYVYSINEIEDDIKRNLRRNENAIRKSNIELNEHELIRIISSEEERIKNETWIDIFNQSRIFFRKKGEDYIGGKYGELMLFALVEGVLECKMVAHKIKHLTNVNDEIKGSDGIFLGNYNKSKAILFGESKVMQSMSGAIVDALDSIDRYHNYKESAHNKNHELIIAREHIHKYNVKGVNIDELYDRLDSSTDEYKEQLLVHPIILMYERSFIKKIQKKANTHDEFNQMITKELIERFKRKDEVFDLIKKHVKKHNLEHSFLDFFLIPVDDVSKFRNAMDDKLL